MPSKLPLQPPNPYFSTVSGEVPGKTCGTRARARTRSPTRLRAWLQSLWKRREVTSPSPLGVREARGGNGSGGTAGAPRRRRVQRGASRAAAPRPSLAPPGPRPSRPSPSRPSIVARYLRGGRVLGDPTRCFPPWDSVVRRGVQTVPTGPSPVVAPMVARGARGPGSSSLPHSCPFPSQRTLGYYFSANKNSDNSSQKLNCFHLGSKQEIKG